MFYIISVYKIQLYFNTTAINSQKIKLRQFSYFDQHQNNYLLKNLFNKTNIKLGMMACACDPSTWRAEAGGSGFQGQLQLHNQLEASLGYIISCLRAKQEM